MSKKEKGEIIGRISAEHNPPSQQTPTQAKTIGDVMGGPKPPFTLLAKFKLGVPKIPARKITIPLSEEERKARSEQFRMYADQIAAQMHDSVAWIWWYKQLPSDEQPLYHSECEVIRKDIREMRSYEEVAYRNVAQIAFADALIKNCPEFREWFEITLEELLEAGFLVQLEGNSKGSKFYGAFYGLNELFDKNDSAMKVWGSLKNLYERTLETQHRLREARQKELIADAGEQISLAELKEKKAGKIILQVPDLKNPTNRYPFLVKSDGERIFPIRALGGIERVVGEIVEAGVSVPVSSLSLPDAGLRGKAGILHSILRRTIQVAEREEKEKARVAEQKAKSAEEFQKRIDGLRADQEADRQILRPKATLNDQEFLVDRKPGIWFMDFGTRPFTAKVWNEKTKRRENKPVHGLMALLERDELSKVRAIECPEVLNEFFVGHREFVAEGDNFYGLGKLGYAIREVERRLGLGQSNGNGKKETPSEVSERGAEPAESMDSEQEFVQAMMNGEGEDSVAVTVAAEAEAKE